MVGFLGDGVNDAPAMHAADTSLSVQEAVDVAREAADFVLLERGLDVISTSVLASLAAITIGYVAATELAKRWFYAPPDEHSPRRCTTWTSHPRHPLSA